MDSKNTEKLKTSTFQDSSHKSESFRIEALKVTIEKKRECNSKALEVVAKCSEETISEDSLIENLKFINQEHYQDIVVERAINKLCGYPVCLGLLRNIPAKQFHISTVHNKVFDITDRKSFCSNLCYKASKFLKDQILTSPVWLRESDVKESYKLISLQSEHGSAGDEVDFGITFIAADKLEDKIEDKESSKLENDFYSKEYELCTRKQMTHDIDSIGEEDEQYYDCFDGFSVEDSTEHQNNSIGSIVKDVSECAKARTGDPDTFTSEKGASCSYNPCATSELLDYNNKKPQEHSKECNFIQDIVVDDTAIKNVKSRKQKKSVLKKKSSNSKPIEFKPNVSSGENAIHNLVLNVEKVLKEWFTLESVCFVFGEEKLKEMIEEKYNHITQWRHSSSSTHDIYFYERYLSLCRRIKILELKDNQIDASFKEQVKSPLPDFQTLKEETEEMQLKVNRFIKGDKVNFEELSSVNEGDNDFSHKPVLPLVDLHAQKTLRKHIVLDRMRKTVEDLRLSLGLQGVDLTEDIRSLISTFTLSAHNITLKPAEWNLVSIIIIKLLSFRDKVLEQYLKSSASNKHLTLLLMSYSLDPVYLDRLVLWLTNLDSLIQNF